MNRLIFLLLILNIKIFGQNPKIYSVTLGTLTCKPTYQENKENEPPEILSATHEELLLNNPPIRFPARPDTIAFFNNVSKKKTIEVKMIDNYQFECGMDSISENQIDNLINGELVITENNKKQTLLRFDLLVVYKDGRQKFATVRTKKISESMPAKQLVEKKNNLLFIGISSITFKSPTKKALTIPEGYGWKVINSR